MQLQPRLSARICRRRVHCGARDEKQTSACRNWLHSDISAHTIPLLPPCSGSTGVRLRRNHAMVLSVDLQRSRGPRNDINQFVNVGCTAATPTPGSSLAPPRHPLFDDVPSFTQFKQPSVSPQSHVSKNAQHSCNTTH